jgi:hypothetical protein
LDTDKTAESGQTREQATNEKERKRSVQQQPDIQALVIEKKTGLLASHSFESGQRHPTPPTVLTADGERE